MAVARLSWAVKLPCWNSTLTIWYGIAMRATAAGMVSSNTSSMPRLSVAMAAASSPARRWRDSTGQQHHAGGRPNDRQGELVDAIGVVEIGDGAVLPGRDLRADHKVDLHHARADDSRQHQAEELAHLGVRRGRGRCRSMPARWQAITIHRNWPTPATVIAQARA